MEQLSETTCLGVCEAIHDCLKCKFAESGVQSKRCNTCVDEKFKPGVKCQFVPKVAKP